MKHIFSYFTIALLAASTSLVQAAWLGNGEPKWDARIYPNPNNGVFSLMILDNTRALDVVVFNVLGEKVFELQVLGDHGAKIDLSKLQKGLYVVQVIDHERSEVLTRRMYIE
jgi:hypothetical protein